MQISNKLIFFCNTTIIYYNFCWILFYKVFDEWKMLILKLEHFHCNLKQPFQDSIFSVMSAFLQSLYFSFDITLNADFCTRSRSLTLHLDKLEWIQILSDLFSLLLLSFSFMNLKWELYLAKSPFSRITKLSPPKGWELYRLNKTSTSHCYLPLKFNSKHPKKESFFKIN